MKASAAYRILQFNLDQLCLNGKVDNEGIHITEKNLRAILEVNLPYSERGNFFDNTNSYAEKVSVTIPYNAVLRQIFLMRETGIIKYPQDIGIVKRPSEAADKKAPYDGNDDVNIKELKLKANNGPDDKYYFLNDIIYVNLNSTGKYSQQKITALLKGLTLEYSRQVNVSGKTEIVEQKLKYVLFERSASQQRQNILVMVLADLYEDENLLKKRIRCGLPESPTVVASKYSAYRALMLTSGVCISTNKIQERSILVLKDYTVNDWLKLCRKLKGVNISDSEKLELISKCVTIGYKTKKNANGKEEIVVNENNELIPIYNLKADPDSADSDLNSTDPEQMVVEENIVGDKLFDGEGLISTALANDIRRNIKKKDEDKINASSFQIRMPFVKGVVHEVDFHGMLKELLGDKYKDAHIDDIFGCSKKISDIHMILTASMFKAYKLYENAAYISSLGEITSNENIGVNLSGSIKSIAEAKKAIEEAEITFNLAEIQKAASAARETIDSLKKSDNGLKTALSGNSANASPTADVDIKNAAEAMGYVNKIKQVLIEKEQENLKGSTSLHKALTRAVGYAETAARIGDVDNAAKAHEYALRAIAKADAAEAKEQRCEDFANSVIKENEIKELIADYNECMSAKFDYQVICDDKKSSFTTDPKKAKKLVTDINSYKIYTKYIDKEDALKAQKIAKEIKSKKNYNYPIEKLEAIKNYVSKNASFNETNKELDQRIENAITKDGDETLESVQKSLDEYVAKNINTPAKALTIKYAEKITALISSYVKNDSKALAKNLKEAKDWAYRAVSKASIKNAENAYNYALSAVLFYNISKQADKFDTDLKQGKANVSECVSAIKNILEYPEFSDTISKETVFNPEEWTKKQFTDEKELSETLKTLKTAASSRINNVRITCMTENIKAETDEVKADIDASAKYFIVKELGLSDTNAEKIADAVLFAAAAQSYADKEKNESENYLEKTKKLTAAAKRAVCVIKSVNANNFDDVRKAFELSYEEYKYELALKARKNNDTTETSYSVRLAKERMSAAKKAYDKKLLSEEQIKAVELKKPDVISYYIKNFNECKHRLFVSGCDEIFRTAPFTISNYQFMSTLDENADENIVHDLIRPSVNAAWTVRQSIDSQTISFMLRNRLPAESDDEQDSEETPDSSEESSDDVDTNEIAEKNLTYEVSEAKMLQKNTLISRTSVFKEVMDKDRLTVDLSYGHIMMPGKMLYLSGDLMQLCCLMANDITDRTFKNDIRNAENNVKKAENDENKLKAKNKLEAIKAKKESVIDTIEVWADEVISCGDGILHSSAENRYYTPCVTDELTAIIDRNPHLSRHEHVVLDALVPKEKSVRKKYFDHLKGTLMLGIDQNRYVQRLGGADFDGDIVRLFFDPAYIAAAESSKLLEPLVIPSVLATEVKYDDNARRELVIRATGNRVGKFSNLAFRSSLIAYDRRIVDEKLKRHAKADLIKLSCLTGLEIDSVKTGIKPEFSYDILAISNLDKDKNNDDDDTKEKQDKDDPKRLEFFIGYKDAVKKSVDKKISMPDMESGKTGKYSIVEYLPFVFNPQQLNINDELMPDKFAVDCRNILWNVTKSSSNNQQSANAANEKNTSADSGSNEKSNSKNSLTYKKRTEPYTSYSPKDVKLYTLLNDRIGSESDSVPVQALWAYQASRAILARINKDKAVSAKNQKLENIKKLLIQKYDVFTEMTLVHDFENAAKLLWDEDAILEIIFKVLPWKHLTNAELRRQRFNKICKSLGIVSKDENGNESAFEISSNDIFDNVICMVSDTVEGTSDIAKLILENKPADDAETSAETGAAATIKNLMAEVIKAARYDKYDSLEKSISSDLSDEQKKKVLETLITQPLTESEKEKLDTQWKRLVRKWRKLFSDNDPNKLQKAAKSICSEPLIDIVNEKDEALKLKFLEENIFDEVRELAQVSSLYGDYKETKSQTSDDSAEHEKKEAERLEELNKLIASINRLEELLSKNENWQFIPAFLNYARASAVTNNKHANQKKFRQSCETITAKLFKSAKDYFENHNKDNVPDLQKSAYESALSLDITCKLKEDAEEQHIAFVDYHMLAETPGVAAALTEWETLNFNEVSKDEQENIIIGNTIIRKPVADLYRLMYNASFKGIKPGELVRLVLTAAINLDNEEMIVKTLLSMEKIISDHLDNNNAVINDLEKSIKNTADEKEKKEYSARLEEENKKKENSYDVVVKELKESIKTAASNEEKDKLITKLEKAKKKKSDAKAESKAIERLVFRSFRNALFESLGTGSSIKEVTDFKPDYSCGFLDGSQAIVLKSEMSKDYKPINSGFDMTITTIADGKLPEDDEKLTDALLKRIKITSDNESELEVRITNFNEVKSNEKLLWLYPVEFEVSLSEQKILSGCFTRLRLPETDGRIAPGYDDIAAEQKLYCKFEFVNGVLKLKNTDELPAECKVRPKEADRKFKSIEKKNTLKKFIWGFLKFEREIFEESDENDEDSENASSDDANENKED